MPPGSHAKTLFTQPLMVVVGEQVGACGAYRDGCEIIGRAASRKKELVVVEGCSHYDLYDQPEPVGQALARLIPFYQENL
ncbi:MAG: alpha/beta hydrolase [Alcaligenaceae bacterium]|nr:alpha/beta hydrolase [Alcaligenaceae bacterium]